MPSPPDLPSRLFLIDAMSLIFRAFYAPMETELTSPSGMPTKAVYIFVRTIRKLLKAYPSDHVAVAFDLPSPTFRDELFEDYKANRAEFPEELEPQLPYIRQFCQAHNLPILEKEGFEADDIIGTLSTIAGKKGMEVIIISGDKDLFQLVTNQVKVLRSSSGGQETLFDEAKVEETMGVKPAQIVDLLALCGDSSDNIPGARPLPGQEPKNKTGKRVSYIGQKGAPKLIRQFGSLEAVLDNADQVKEAAYKNALIHYRKEALLSRQLATIRTDLDLKVDLDELRAEPPDFARLGRLARELGFTSLAKEILDEIQTTTPSVAAEAEAAGPTSASQLKQWLAALPTKHPVAVSFQMEGDGDYSGELTAIGFHSESQEGCWADLHAASAATLKTLKPFFEDTKQKKSVHHEKLLRMQLAKAGIGLAGVVHDPMLYSFLLDPLTTKHSLGEAAARRLFEPLPPDPVRQAEITERLVSELTGAIDSQQLRPLYEDIELPLSAVLAEIESLGIRLDRKVLAKMSRTFEKELTELTGKIYELAGQAFDINSPKQLGEILFGKLQLPGGRKLKKSGQYATDASVLESLSETHELPRRVLEYRTRAKLKSTYIDALPKFVHPKTGRIHSTFHQTVARTGRLSSSNPNLQNIPIGNEYGQRIRSAFVAEPGTRLLSADYSQIELRVLAHLSEDPLLIEAFSDENIDIHALTAQEIFGVPAALQTHEHRRMAKAINYGVVYGLSAFGLAQRTGASRNEAQEFIDEYFRRYKRVKQFLDRTVEEARNAGQVRTLFGRLRPIPEIRSKDPATRNRAEREAVNTPVQGTAADLLKLAMIKLDRRIKKEKLRSRMILTVHDELVFEVPDQEQERMKEIVRAEMEQAYPLRVPLKVDMGIGPNWKEAK